MRKEIGKLNKSGTSLIEALTLLFIFSVIIVTFYQVFTVGSRYIIDSKNRLGAVALAGEKMEIIRNLNYDDIGTDTGTVSGNILENEDVAENGRSFHVTTTVDYVQDDFDGLFPADLAFEDYKQVNVSVIWNGVIGTQSVNLSSLFVPKGLEVADPNSGILAVNVISDQAGGAGVSGASVHIENDDPAIMLNTTRMTDSTGGVVFMGDKITNSIQEYRITVSKAGYETIATSDPYPTPPATTYNPVNLHASVVLGTINVKNIIQNELADLTIRTVDYLDQPIGNIAFDLSGGRQIGTEIFDALDPTPCGPIYEPDKDGSTDSEGEKEYAAISPGPFTFSLDPLVTDYELIGTSPASPFALPSDPALEFKVTLAKKDITSLLVKVTRADGVAISGAQVRLSNSLGYDTTVTSLYNGAAFFPVTADEFVAGTYDLEIIATGYETNTSQVTVNDDELKIETKALTAS